MSQGHYAEMPVDEEFSEVQLFHSSLFFIIGCIV